jgi:hypothetical protein
MAQDPQDDLPPPIEATPSLTPVIPPPGSPDAARRAGAASAAPVQAAPVAAPLPLERLAFTGGRKPATETVPLDFPFERDGVLIEAVTVRRLTVADVADAVDGPDYAQHGIWALYAAQAGLPIGVLRGLDEDDGDRVLEVARRFLPRVFAAILAVTADAATSSMPTPESGAATSPG